MHAIEPDGDFDGRGLKDEKPTEHANQATLPQSRIRLTSIRRHQRTALYQSIIGSQSPLKFLRVPPFASFAKALFPKRKTRAHLLLMTLKELVALAHRSTSQRVAPSQDPGLFIVETSGLIKYYRASF